MFQKNNNLIVIEEIDEHPYDPKDSKSRNRDKSYKNISKNFDFS